MPGVGARNIEAIAKDVLKWNRLGERLPLMDAIAEDLEEQAYIASSSVVTDDSLATLSFDEIIEIVNFSKHNYFSKFIDGDYVKVSFYPNMEEQGYGFDLVKIQYR